MTDEPDRTGISHPSVFEPATLVLLVVLCAFGAAVGLELLVSLGVTPNTSLIGALVAMLLARAAPLAAVLRPFRSIHVQNLAQTGISAATFGAANSLLLPIGIPFLLGRGDLVLPMLCGAFLALLLDAFLLYRLFDSRIFPASGAWPPGVAAAEAIRAGDTGGRKAGILGLGFVIGLAGAALQIPLSAAGVALIGNIWALAMFAIALLLRGYETTLLGGPVFAGVVPRGDLMAAYIPQGIMIGAGLVALLQVGATLARRPAAAEGGGTIEGSVRRTLGLGAVGFVAIAALLATVSGLAFELPVPTLIAFVLYAACAAYVHELIVGLAAMHSGWFPAFAVALITLLVGLLIGFPPPALALLTGFAAATGPAFADMGYDLKAGYMLRGSGANPAFERAGRRQQLLAAMLAFLVAGAVVLWAYPGYFAHNQVPPIDRVFAAAIGAGVAPGVVGALVMWAVPGALLQLLGGPSRQIGIMFATGLLIDEPLAGWAALGGIALRLILLRLRVADSEREVFAGGLIAGDAIYGFAQPMWRRYLG